MTLLRGDAWARLLLVATGLAGILAAYLLRDSGVGHVAFVLVPIALVQISVGAFGLARLPAQRRGLALRLVEDPALFREDEILRMEQATRKGRFSIAIDVVALALSLLVAIVTRIEEVFLAVALACAAEAALLLLLDLAAWRRRRRYETALSRFLDPAAPVTGEPDLGE